MIDYMRFPSNGTSIDLSMHDDDDGEQRNRITFVYAGAFAHSLTLSFITFIHFLTDFQMTFSPTFSDSLNEMKWNLKLNEN